MHLRSLTACLALLRPATRITFIPTEGPTETSLEVACGAVDAKVMDALSRTPGIDVRLGDGGLGPLFLAAAVVAAMHEGEDDSEGGEADDEDDKHDDPFPVGGEPGAHQRVSMVAIGNLRLRLEHTYQGPLSVASAFVTACEFPTVVAPELWAGLFCTWLTELVACIGAPVEAGWLALGAPVVCSAFAPALQNPWYQF